MSDGAQASLYDKKRNVVSSVVEQMASWLDDAPAEEVNQGMHEAIQDALIPKTDDDCTVAVIRRGSFIQPYSCPVCKNSESLKGDGKTKYRITCNCCGHIQKFESTTGRGYPEHTKDWVRFLFNKHNKDLKRVSQITNVSQPSIRRWIGST